MDISLLLIGASFAVLALVCTFVVIGIRRALLMHQIELLAHDIRAHGLGTLWYLPLVCNFCKGRRYLSEFRYGPQQQKQLLICAACARRLDRQLSQIEQHAVQPGVAGGQSGGALPRPYRS
jgi:hypothetical protein